jgi:hypothetical protein
MMTKETSNPCRTGSQKHTTELIILLIGTLLVAYLLSGKSPSMTNHATADICHAKVWQQLPLPLYFFFTEGCGTP